MSLAPDKFTLMVSETANMKRGSLGLTGVAHHVVTGVNSSPTNSSQSDTATTADAHLSLGPRGTAAGDVGSHPIKGSSARPVLHTTAVAGYAHNREWLYRLVTFPHYFTPCVSCCGGATTPKREQLMTLFDTRAPHSVFCCHCPVPQGSTSHFSASHGRDGALLQVRRSSFKNAVNANDITRFGADLGGVQQYTLNGNKIIYLAREASAKKTGHGAPPPATCTVDGRAMMDKNSLYCSLMCKMQAEDPGFMSWLDSQDPSVRIMAQVAANAPPVPTVACKRIYYSSSRDDSASPKSSGSNAQPRRDSSGSSGQSAGAPLGVVPPASGVMPEGGVLLSAFSASAGAPGTLHQGSRPQKAPRLTARSSSAPLAFAAAVGGNVGGYNGSNGNEVLLMGMTGRSSSGALLEGLTCRPVARQLLHNDPNASAVEAAARQAAVAAAAAAFSGAGTTAAAAAARDALGAAGLAPNRTGTGSPLYSTITLQPQHLQQPVKRPQQAQPPKPSPHKQQKPHVRQQAGAPAAAAGGGLLLGSKPAVRPIKVTPAVPKCDASAPAAGGCAQVALQPPVIPCPPSPVAPGLDTDATYAPFGSSSRGLPEPFLATRAAGPSTCLSAFSLSLEPSFCVSPRVDGLPDIDFDDSMMPAGSGGPWGSSGDIAGLLGVSGSNSPLHVGLDGLDALFGHGGLSPTPQMLF